MQVRPHSFRSEKDHYQGVRPISTEERDLFLLIHLGTLQLDGWFALSKQALGVAADHDHPLGVTLPIRLDLPF